MSIHTRDDGSPNTFTYLFTDNFGNRIADLPCRGVTFTLALNTSGPFSITLDVNDPRVAKTAWINATAPNLAQFWVDINGTLVYGGRVTKRTYSRADGTVTVTGSDHWSYLAQRLQAGDYTTQWNTTPTGAAQIAQRIISDALGTGNSLGVNLNTPAATPSQYGITLTAPRSQRMTVDALVTMISGLGYLVGFDFASDVRYVSGFPTPTYTLSYPRRGRIAGTTGLVLDIAGATAFTWDEDGTQQANSVAQTATSGGGVAIVGQWAPSMTVDGYPLLEKVAMHTMFSATNTAQSVLNAFAADDLALAAYPVVTPQVTLPMFTEPVIGEWIVGDDVRIIVPAVATNNVPVDPRFPTGMDRYWRIIRADCTVPTEGVPTINYTFNMTPSTTPQRPPQ